MVGGDWDENIESVNHRASGPEARTQLEKLKPEWHPDHDKLRAIGIRTPMAA